MMDNYILLSTGAKYWLNKKITENRYILNKNLNKNCIERLKEKYKNFMYDKIFLENNNNIIVETIINNNNNFIKDKKFKIGYYTKEYINNLKLIINNKNKQIKELKEENKKLIKNNKLLNNKLTKPKKYNNSNPFLNKNKRY